MKLITQTIVKFLYILKGAEGAENYMDYKWTERKTKITVCFGVSEEIDLFSL